jgi:tetratricopeptide (TPR) repeat protein
VSPTPAIALCMIVRDEEAVIERCIASARPLISSWTICDTGSEDATPEMIERLLGDLPGELHRRPWTDFGANRSELMELARGTADYLLLLDADMTLEVSRELPDLTADAYLLPHAGTVTYSVQRLVSGSRRWWFEGATHEYLATEGEFSQEPLDALLIHHHADGGARADKLGRDASLLSGRLQEDPEDQRATFYLAQTRRDQGRTSEAIDLYRRRAALGGWDEETFYAAYQAGVLLAAEGRTEEAVRTLVEAHQRRPSRAEPLYELARICRAEGRHLAAYRFGKRAADLPVPDDILFVHRDVHEWRALFELSVSAFWAGEPEEGLAACDRLLTEGLLPADLLEAVQANRAFCLDASAVRGAEAGVEQLADVVPAARFAELQLRVEPDWPQFNPSILAVGDRFLVNVRTASYRAEPGNRYESLHPDGRIHTINYLAELDAELGLGSVSVLEDAAPGARVPDALLDGYEDVRLVETPAGLLGLATVGDRNADGRLEMALLRIEGGRVVEATVLRGPDRERHERNWMPFVVDDDLLLVYSVGPTVILRCDVESGALSRVAEHPAPEAAVRMRGGSQGIPVAGGHLFCIHEVLFAHDGRHYVHRLVLLDEELRFSAASRRFGFGRERLEFCAGLARLGADLVLSFGVGDRHAGLAICPEADLLALLEEW